MKAENPHLVPSTATRRRFLRCTAGLAAGSLAALSWPRRGWSADPAPSRVSSADALKELLEGNARYVRGETSIKDFSANRAALAVKQSPHSVILGCSDSRVAPELAFDQGRGDLFVVRVAGNFLHDDGLASIEYAVEILGSSLIVVLGHTNCGAVDAAIKVVQDNATLPGHLPYLIRELKPAVTVAKLEKGDLLANAIRANVRLNVADLESAKPILAEKVAAGKVKVVGGIYHLETGKVEMLT